MANKTQTIRIESILGGISPTQYFAQENQYLDAIAVDPMMPEKATNGETKKPSGILRPIPSKEYGLGTLNNTPLWMVHTPKNYNTYVYDFGGSVYALEWLGVASFSGIGDLNDGGTARGNGAAYYDNYIYFSRDTTVARYGPLNGTPSFADDYWVTTLGKTALTNTEYPSDNVIGSVDMPNHVMQRHSDGRIYFADVVGGKATIHYISTTKTTVEGDTDNGSTYNALDLGYGLLPTAMASYGEFLVIALHEGIVSSGIEPGRFPGRAQIVFWNGISDSPNKIVFDAFPDPVITAMTVLNGVLYVVSALAGTSRGCRVSKYIGGDSFSEVAYLPGQYATLPGGVVGHGNRLFFGSAKSSDLDTSLQASVYALDVDGPFAGALHSVMAAQEYGGGAVYSLSLAGVTDDPIVYPIAGYGVGFANLTSNGIFGLGTSLQPSGGSASSNREPVWWSQQYRIGRPFKIVKIRLPLAEAITTNNQFTVTIWFDGQDDNNKTLTSISNSNSSGKRLVTLRPENATGNHSFWIQIEWVGTAPISIALPITIEYELIDD